jgi:hypothetical protein
MSRNLKIAQGVGVFMKEGAFYRKFNILCGSMQTMG